MGIKGTVDHWVAFFFGGGDSVHELENKTVFTSPGSPLPTCSILKFIQKSLVIYMDFKLFLATFQSSGHRTHLKEPHNH